MKIFLSGGTGFVGGHLRKALLERGHTIRLLVHRRVEWFEGGIEPVEGDVTRLETFSNAVAGCDATINLVGIIREFPGKGVTFERLHVQATENVLRAAQEAGVRRHLQMSALGAREAATSAYHRSKFMAEEIVRGSGLDYTIFCPSIIFGPADDFINKLAQFVRLLPAVPVIGDGKYRLQPISADDVARCFVLALEMPETSRKTFCLCGKDRITYNELLDLIGRVLGRTRVLKAHSPLGMMKLMVPFLQKFPLFPITMDQITMLVEENICDGSWQDTFGFSPEPLAEGIRSYLGGIKK